MSRPEVSAQVRCDVDAVDVRPRPRGSRREDHAAGVALAVQDALALILALALASRQPRRWRSTEATLRRWRRGVLGLIGGVLGLLGGVLLGLLGGVLGMIGGVLGLLGGVLLGLLGGVLGLFSAC